MKQEQINIGFNAFILLIVLSLFSLNGCQQEVTEIIEPDTDQVFNTISPVSDLILRTSLNDGSKDNIIDNSSCVMLQLPVTVIINGTEILLESSEDFRTVERIIDESDDDDDVIDIVFPIEVILADYSVVQLNSEDDMEDLADQCIEGGDDDDIECVDFKFPIDISIYDTENQRSEVLTIESDKELHDFMEDLDEEDLASINFPIIIILSDLTELLINNNNELEDALENAIGDCDEDDDSDHNDDDIDDSDFVNVLLDGEWEITYFFDDDDETPDFSGFTFTFLNDGKVSAKNGALTVLGAWESFGDDGTLKLELEFEDDSELDELAEDWDVLEFDETTIKLGDADDDEAPEVNIILKKK